MQWSVWYEASEAGYAVIVKQGIRVTHKEFVANEEQYELSQVRGLALKRAAELATENASPQQPEVPVREGRELLS